MPKVSVNLCVFNGENYLREALDSIVNQTYKDWELVIINDGSTDLTESIVKEYINQGHPIIYYYQENHGLGYSRNEALKRSQGEFIAFLDHDDLWLPEKLEMQLPVFDTDDKIGIVISDTYFFNDKEGIVKQLYLKKKPPTGFVFKELLTNYFISLETAMIRRSALDTLTYWFDDRFTMIEECDLFTRLAYQWKLGYVDRPLGKWRMHHNSWTFSEPLKLPEETELMLDRYIQIYDNFTTDYAKEIEHIRVNIDIAYAKVYLEQGRNRAARMRLSPHIRCGYKYVLLFLLSFLPSSIYGIVNQWRGERPT